MKFVVAAMLLLISLAAFGFALWQVSDATAGLQRLDMSVPAVRPGAPSIPILLYRPRGKATGIAIVAHGYAADKELMQGFAIEFARLGLAAYSLDFPGHGEASDRLNTDRTLLEDSLQAVYNYAQQQASHAGEPTRTVLLGHSMGAGAVTLFALDRADDATDVRAVIAVSPAMSDADLARLSPTSPRNLLMMAGSTDLPVSVHGTNVGVANASKGLTPDAADPAAFGDWGKGNARKAALFDGLNHITILLAADPRTEATTWAARSFNLPLPAPANNAREGWTAMMMLAAIVATFPFASLLAVFAPRRPFTPRFMPQVTLGYMMLLVVGSVLALLTLSLFNPLDWLGLALVPYLASYFFIAGGIIWLVLRLWLPTSLPRFQLEGVAGGFVVAVIGWLFWYLVYGLGTTFALFRLSFSGNTLDRLGIMLIVTLAVFPFTSADDAVWRGWQENGRLWLGIFGGIVSKLVVFAALLLAIALDPALGFLGIVLPILALLFIVAQLFSTALYAATRNIWASAWWDALFLAWVLVMLFPKV